MHLTKQAQNQVSNYKMELNLVQSSQQAHPVQSGHGNAKILSKMKWKSEQIQRELLQDNWNLKRGLR